MKTLWHWWSLIGPVVAMAVNLYFAVRSYRSMRRADRAMHAMAAAHAQTLMSLAPALGFIAALRDSPHAPDELRRHAAAVIPPGIVITRDDTGTVH